jgi:multisubunit Na+/H+ antiporter MnhB subunit
MKKKIDWLQALYIFGIATFIIGALDPLEGSVVVFIGSSCIALSAYLKKEKDRKLFLTSAILILLGVVFLFYLSSLGGIGGKSALSWWWGLLILPYPIGWLITVVLLVIRIIKKYKQ